MIKMLRSGVRNEVGTMKISYYDIQAISHLRAKVEKISSIFRVSRNRSSYFANSKFAVSEQHQWWNKKSSYDTKHQRRSTIKSIASYSRSNFSQLVFQFFSSSYFGGQFYLAKVYCYLNAKKNPRKNAFKIGNKTLRRNTPTEVNPSFNSRKSSFKLRMIKLFTFLQYLKFFGITKATFKIFFCRVTILFKLYSSIY